MQDVIAGVLVLSGVALMLLAAVGVVRMPDLFTRMQATTKAASLGTALVLLGAAVHFARLGVTTRALAAIAFVMVTTPIAAHLLGRAAYLLGLPVGVGAVHDELRERYQNVRGERRRRPSRNLPPLPGKQKTDQE